MFTVYGGDGTDRSHYSARGAAEIALRLEDWKPGTTVQCGCNFYEVDEAQARWIALCLRMV